MINLGRVRPGSTIYIPFETFANSTGAPITLTGLATSDIQVYKDGGTTQRASASGFTLLDTDGIDFDGITGIHGFSIDLSDNTTADFWASGSRYFVVVSTVTVDSQTMSFIAATFSIGYEGSWIDTYIATLASQTSFTLSSGPAEDDALNGHWAIIHDAASAVQSARVLISDYTGASKTVTLAAGATFTAAAKDNISIMGMAPMQPVVVGRQLAVDTSNRASADALAINSVATSSVTTVNAHIGTTNAINFFGSGVTGYVKADVRTVTGNAQSAGDIVSNQDTIYNDLSAVKAKTDSLTFTVAGKVDANATHISGDSTAADNAESFFDGTGYGAHVLRSTVASITSQTVFRLAGGSTGVPNAYVGAIVVIRDHSITADVMFAVCTGWDENYLEITINPTSGATFTISTGNYVEIMLPSFSEDDRTTLGASGGGSTVDATYVDAAHTWTFPSSVQTTATRIINELIGFNGIACMDFTSVIPSDVAISSVDSASFANISGTEPTVGTTSVSTNLKKVLIPVNATSATANTYTLSVTVTTTDSQQFTRKGQFTVA